MLDLRKLTPEKKRELQAEAERRARAGDAPKTICAALGLTKSIYARWAREQGFRQADLRAEADPDQATCADETPLSSAVTVLQAVRAALVDEDHARADKLIADWKRRTRHQRDLKALELAAAEDLAAMQARPLDDQALAARVSELIGRTVCVISSESAC